MKQVCYRRPTHIRHHRTKFSRPGDQAPGICAPLVQSVRIWSRHDDYMQTADVIGESGGLRYECEQRRDAVLITVT
jgi:hypothetical protein